MEVDTVKQALQANGEEYEFDGGTCSIGGHASGPSAIRVGHFVVQRDARQQGLAETMLAALYEVMRDEGRTHLTIEMGATECRTEEELAAYREEHDAEDPTYQFLAAEGFQNLRYQENWQWGLLVKGQKHV